MLTEYENIPKRWPNRECSIAQLPENAERNRFQDVLPYDATRVELVPTKENNTGYINASHIKVSSSKQQPLSVILQKEAHIFLKDVSPHSLINTLLYLYGNLYFIIYCF